MSVSSFCSVEVCEAVFAEQSPAISKIVQHDGGTGLHIAVVDPGLTPEQVESLVALDKWDRVMVWEKSVGDVPEGSRFITNARNKAVEAHFYRETLSAVWANRAAVLRSARVAWYGGVHHHGISVGVSGLNEIRDEEVAYELVAVPLAKRVESNARWGSPEARVAQIREWGGLLP